MDTLEEIFFLMKIIFTLCFQCVTPLGIKLLGRNFRQMTKKWVKLLSSIHFCVIL